MLRRPPCSALVAAVLATVACGAPTSRPSQTLDRGSVAAVGDVRIPDSLVRLVAAAESVPARSALNALVEDALAASAARTAGMENGLAWPLAAANARGLAQTVMREAAGLGPATEAELGTVTVSHALVMRGPNLTREKALATAAAIHDATSVARSPDEFESLASAVQHWGAQVVVQRVEGFGADGRAPGGTHIDEAFVAAAFALKAAGAMSPVIETSFGWHTLYLMRRSPPDASEVARRRVELASVVVEMRARVRIQALLRARRERTAIELAGGADELMAAATADR